MHHTTPNTGSVKLFQLPRKNHSRRDRAAPPGFSPHEGRPVRDAPSALTFSLFFALEARPRITWSVASLLSITLALWLSALPAPDHPDVGYWVERVEHSFRAATLPPPRRSAELDRAARVAVSSPPGTDVRRLLRQSGLYDGMLLPLVMDQHRLLRVARAGSRYIADHVVPLGVTHYGLAERGDRVVVVFSRRKLTLSKPLRPTGVGLAPLAGLLSRDYRQARVLVGRPGGQIESYLADVSGGEFSSFVHFREPGVYQVEILAQGPRGQEVVGLMTRRFGPPPALPLARPDSVEARTVRPAQVRRSLLSWINKARAKLGLKRLRRDPLLRATAAEHARSMADARQAAHRLPGGLSAAERLSNAGVVTRRFFENVAMAKSAQQAHAELWASPSHRQALVDPRVTHIGIGVRSVASPVGRVLYITQHLAEKAR